MKKRRILCVHRGASIEIVCGALEKGGCQVLSASDAREALKLLNCHDLSGVVLDSDLRTTDGLTLRTHILHRCPDMPMLLLSPGADVAEMPLAVFGAYVREPNSPSDVLDSLYSQMPVRA